MYNYTIKEITKIYDADTITVIIDLGFGILTKHILRFSRINAPEMKGTERKDGIVSRDWLRHRLNTAMENGQEVTIKTLKDKTGKYGRYIAEVFVDGICVNDELVDNGLAIYKDY